MSRALVVHQGALGDLLLSLPSIRLLGKHHSELILAAREPHGRLLFELGEVNHYLDSSSQDFVPFYTGRIPTLLGRVSRVYCFSRSRTEVSWERSAWIRTVPAEPVSVARFQLSQVIEILGSSGSCSNLFQPLILPRDSHPRQDASLVTVHPGSGGARKCWPWERFEALLSRLKSETSVKFALVCGPAEPDGLRTEMKEFAERLGFELWASPDLSALVRGLGRSRLYLGNDSGVTHLAAWTGARVLALFGPTDPAKWAPPHRWVEVVRPELPCCPCDEKYRDCSRPECMEEIGVAEVLEKMKCLLG